MGHRQKRQGARQPAGVGGMPALELLRATEASAIAACRWIGTGDKLSADRSATVAMTKRLDRIDFSAEVVLGEGKKDNSYGLFSGDRVGRKKKTASPPRFDIAVDPIDGTRPTVTSGPEAMSVLAIGERKTFFQTEAFYMNKLAYGPAIAEKTALHLRESLSQTVHKASKATGKPVSTLVVCLLDRPRHESIIRDFRRIGIRIKLIQDCDISAAIATCLPESGIDLLYGAGGAAEAVLAACAMKCLKGGFEAQIAGADGRSLDGTVYTIERLVGGDCAFAATGITNGSLLRGVRFTNRGPVTHSVLMRSQSGTVRWLTTCHGGSPPHW